MTWLLVIVIWLQTPSGRSESRELRADGLQTLAQCQQHGREAVVATQGIPELTGAAFMCIEPPTT